MKLKVSSAILLIGLLTGLLQACNLSIGNDTQSHEVTYERKEQRGIEAPATEPNSDSTSSGSGICNALLYGVSVGPGCPWQDSRQGLRWPAYDLEAN